jgi:hypothetical protein
VVPGIAAVVLWWAGRGPGTVVLVGATLALLALGLVAPRAAQRLDDALRRAARVIGTGVGRALSVVAWVVGLLPLWALSRLVGYSPVDHGWADERSAWSAADLGHQRDPHRRPMHAARSGSHEGEVGPRPARGRTRRRILVSAAVLAIAGQLAVALARQDRITDERASVIDLREPSVPDASRAPDGPVTFAGLPVDSYAHEDEPFAQELFRELVEVGGMLRPDPVVGARNVEVYLGDHVNLVDGRRVTYTPVEPELEVWFFGGSTMFGIGQRDDHTIPSVVAKLAEMDGIRIRATNFGVNGDVNWQETIRFAELLPTARPAPDLVVFYDGWNDQSLGRYRVEIGSSDTSVSERLPFSDLDRRREPVILGDRARVTNGIEQAVAGIPLSAAQYGRGVRTARALAAAEGIEALHFWQPIADVKQYFPSDDEMLRRTATLPGSAT